MADQAAILQLLGFTKVLFLSSTKVYSSWPHLKENLSDSVKPLIDKMIDKTKPWPLDSYHMLVGYN